jgi:hypothetical protein
MDRGNLSRRGFLQRSIAALTVGAGLPAWYAQEILAASREAEEGEKKVIGANDKITMGVIGLGYDRGRAKDLYHAAKNNKQVQFVATCNVDKNHLDWGVAALKKDGYDATGYKDFRELLDRKDIDAVLIAVPDHWHTLMPLTPCERRRTFTVKSP